MQLYVHYLKGVLPYGGGLLDQPAIYLNAMRLIDERIQFIQAERR